MGTRYRLRRLAPEEIGHQFWQVCSRGKGSVPGVVKGWHEVRPVFEFAFEYIRGKPGKECTRTIQLCELHACEVAGRFGLEVPAEGQTRYERAGGYPERKTGRCKCGNPGLPLHPCPYDADLDNSKVPTCNCCETCQEDCVQEL